MQDPLIAMALLLICGSAWHLLRPLQQHAEQQRQAISRLVYFMLLPALVLQVMWHSAVDGNSVRIALVAAITILTSMGVAIIYFQYRHTDRASAGALILASSFANAMYLGLPILEHTYDAWA